MPFFKPFIVLAFLLLSHIVIAQQRPLKLYYTSPAKQWEACVPLGNGRLGAMPDGGIANENITLNDITLWSGGPQEADNPEAYKYLPEIQKLLLKGDHLAAQRLMSKHFKCKGAGSGNGDGANVPYGSYQVLGNLHLRYIYQADTAYIRNYYRELSLNDAVAKTSFQLNDVRYERQYFCSFDNDVLIIKLTASKPHQVSLQLKLDRPERFEVSLKSNELQMKGALNNGSGGEGMRYLANVRIKAFGGAASGKPENYLQVSEADSVIIYVSMGTDYKDPSYVASTASRMEKAWNNAYEQEKKAHQRHYHQLFNRASINLGNDDYANVPTDERLKRFAAGEADNGLPVLYFQYGRYLAISSTRSKLLPPNLQGLWTNTIHTPWNGDYHLDINIQMNQWPLDLTNLGALSGPYLDLVAGLIKSGEKTAKAYYNAPGWVAHVITNIWGYTSPGEDYSWGAYNTGSAWLCQMLWSHYEFTHDDKYLKKIYPILKGSAIFYLDMMVKEPTYGWLVTAPSNSPENAFYLKNGQTANVCAGPTIDNQLVRALYLMTIMAGNKLQQDQDLLVRLKSAVKKLPPNQIGKDGRLMEWLEEYKEVEPHHRHISHLWGLYPGSEIGIWEPALAKAAKASLEARGDAGTGWSLAWKMNYWARLHDGQHAYQLLKMLLKPVSTSTVNMSNGGGTYPNLFCAHPPFQIDGNFGGTAGIAEMLLQSNHNEIVMLPALPNEWSTGSFQGLRVRGGGEISAVWKNKRVTEMTLKTASDNTFKIRVPEGVVGATVVRGNKVMSIPFTDNYLSIKLVKSQLVKLKFQYRS